MTVNLIKLSVGIETIDHLTQVQEGRVRLAEAAGEGPRLFHRTRHMPRRSDELLDGGSIYWIIKGRTRARQRLIGLESDVDEEGRKFCRLMLEPGLVPIDPWPHRPFQGWRYLETKDAPPDRARGQADQEMPEEMIEELRDLGLL
jgi:hypothetical protein